METRYSWVLVPTYKYVLSCGKPGCCSWEQLVTKNEAYIAYCIRLTLNNYDKKKKKDKNKIGKVEEVKERADSVSSEIVSKISDLYKSMLYILLVRIEEQWCVEKIWSEWWDAT